MLRELACNIVAQARPSIHDQSALTVAPTSSLFRSCPGRTAAFSETNDRPSKLARGGSCNRNFEWICSELSSLRATTYHADGSAIAATQSGPRYLGSSKLSPCLYGIHILACRQNPTQRISHDARPGIPIAAHRRQCPAH
jgi:hypothetical protein